MREDGQWGRRWRRTVTVFPVSMPFLEGVDAGGLHALLDAVDRSPELELHSLMVFRHGSIVAQGWWRPYTPERPHLLYSLSKSFTATALGLAVAAGLVGLDDAVLSYFPDLDAVVTDRRSRSMRVRDISAMATGHLHDMQGPVLEGYPDDPVRGFLTLPPEREPGTVFAYNQLATYTLAALLQRATGKTVSKYLLSKLPRVIEGPAFSWLQWPAGQDMGYSGLHATTATVGALGQLYLQKGEWEGVQLFPASWAREATRSQISTLEREDAPDPLAAPDDTQGYGYQFWMSRHGYRADGAYGQFCLVLPQHDTVVATTGQSVDSQALLDTVWQTVLPALRDAPLPGPNGDDELRQRLEDACLPAFGCAPTPAGGPVAWEEATFVPDGGMCLAQPTLVAVRLSRQGGAWLVNLDEQESQIEAILSPADWGLSELTLADGTVIALAAHGGWVSGSFRADIIFLDTPHRLRLTCRLATQTFDASWVTKPLHAPRLVDLRSHGVVRPIQGRK